MIEQVNWNGTATTWTYESRGLISGIRHRKSDNSELGVDLYGYDANANPVTKVTLGGRNTWGYDLLDQLTSEQHEIGLVSTWSYDPVGNRLSQDRTQGGVRTLTNCTVDAASQLTLITEGAARTTVTFDANGNQVSEQSGAGRVTYLWNQRDLLTGYAQPEGKIATFTHRYDDLRASIDPGDGSAATKLAWDPLGATGYVDLLGETAADQSVPRQYWRGARLVSYKEVGQKGVYQFDHLGNTQRVVSAAPAVLAAYQNSAWGEALLVTGSLGGQRFGYGGDWGAYRDALSGDAWMRVRVAKPTVGRWLSLDPLGFGWTGTNLFLYALNNPERWLDPSGAQAVTECDFDTGRVVTTPINRACDAPCTDAHEGQHRYDDRECCRRAARCIRRAASAAEKDACRRAYADWFAATEFYDECQAYRSGRFCREQMAASRRCWEKASKRCLDDCCIAIINGINRDNIGIAYYCEGGPGWPRSTPAPCPFTD